MHFLPRSAPLHGTSVTVDEPASMLFYLKPIVCLRVGVCTQWVWTGVQCCYSIRQRPLPSEVLWALPAHSSPKPSPWQPLILHRLCSSLLSRMLYGSAGGPVSPSTRVYMCVGTNRDISATQREETHRQRHIHLLELRCKKIIHDLAHFSSLLQ